MVNDQRPKWFYLISLSVIFSIGVYLYYYPTPAGDTASTFHPFVTQADGPPSPPEPVTKPGYFVYSDACKISQLPIREPRLEKYFTPEAFTSCARWNDGQPRLVGSNRTHLFVIRGALKFYANATRKVKCNFRPFTWKYARVAKFASMRAKYGKKESLAFPVEITRDEFIRVECFLNKKKIYTDFFSFVTNYSNKSNMVSHNEAKNVLPKLAEFSNTEKIFNEDEDKKKSTQDFDKLKRENSHYIDKSRGLNSHAEFSVLILGIDAVSRLNFLRQMTKSYAYLESHFDLVDMQGYNKIGDNTFPNVVAALTGLSESELRSSCWTSPTATFDACPFLWSDYSARGYRTLFAEDSFQMSTFYYMKSGFQRAPTDYFYSVFSRESEASIGNSRLLNANLCIGSQLIFKTILEYALKFSTAMKNTFYFAFVWTSSLTHDFLNLPRLGDPVLLSFVKNLNKNGLNNTLLVLTSDHGLRWGEFRETFHGHVEERMPFLLFMLPAGFKRKYSAAYGNLLYNQHRLTTPYDLHETLKSLLDVRSLSSDAVNSNESSTRGVSLFRRVPVNRTCAAAGIPPHYCTCHNKLVKTSLRSPIVLGLSRKLAFHINRVLLKPVSAKCHSLKVDKVISAHYEQTLYSLKGNWTQRDYTISVQTVPGLAVFESTMRYNKALGQTNIVGDVSRLNVYANQSSCVDDARLKLYCYCR